MKVLRMQIADMPRPLRPTDADGEPDRNRTQTGLKETRMHAGRAAWPVWRMLTR
jgi:hypothetical protein